MREDLRDHVQRLRQEMTGDSHDLARTVFDYLKTSSVPQIPVDPDEQDEMQGAFIKASACLPAEASTSTQLVFAEVVNNPDAAVWLERRYRNRFPDFGDDIDDELPF